MSVERSRTRLGEDIAGDEAAGSRGIPFRQSDVEDEEFEFGFMPAGRIPTCPGVPNQNPAGDEDCNPDQFDQSYQFNMTQTDVIILVQPGTPTSGSAGCPPTGWVTRAWDQANPLIVEPCTNVEVTGILDATTIGLYAGYPIVNILLFENAFNPGDRCEGLIDTSTDNVAGSFHREFQAPGSTYTFQAHPDTVPAVLPANAPHWFYAHVSASFDSGTADMSFDYE